MNREDSNGNLLDSNPPSSSSEIIYEEKNNNIVVVDEIIHKPSNNVLETFKTPRFDLDNQEFWPLNSSAKFINVGDDYETGSEDSFPTILKKSEEIFQRGDSNSSDDDVYKSSNLGSWTPRTKAYWAAQYSQIENVVNEEQDPQPIVCTENTESDRHEDLKRYPQDADHVPTQKSEMSCGGDGNNNPERNSRVGYPDPTVLYTPFVHFGTNFQISTRFQSSAFRSIFFGKVFFVKFIQVMVVLLAVLGLPFIPPVFEVIDSKAKGAGYLAFLLYMWVLCCTRWFEFGRTLLGAIFSLIFCSTCSVVLCSAIFYHGEPEIVVIIMSTLILSQACLAVTAYFRKIDISEEGIIYAFAGGCVLFNCALAICVTLAISNPLDQQPNFSTKSGRLSSIIIPSMLTSLTIILISELHQIMGGFRVPMTEADVILASSLLP